MPQTKTPDVEPVKQKRTYERRTIFPDGDFTVFQVNEQTGALAPIVDCPTFRTETEARTWLKTAGPQLSGEGPQKVAVVKFHALLTVRIETRAEVRLDEAPKATMQQHSTNPDGG